MTSRDFCFWLQGFFEVASLHAAKDKFQPTPDQTELIQRHLNLVFKHEIDPSMGPKPHQEILDETHHGVDNHPSNGGSIGKPPPGGLVARC